MQLFHSEVPPLVLQGGRATCETVRFCLLVGDWVFGLFSHGSTHIQLWFRRTCASCVRTSTRLDRARELPLPLTPGLLCNGVRCAAPFAFFGAPAPAPATAAPTPAPAPAGFAWGASQPAPVAPAPAPSVFGTAGVAAANTALATKP
jgi:hypothetical protein